MTVIDMDTTELVDFVVGPPDVIEDTGTLLLSSGVTEVVDLTGPGTDVILSAGIRGPAGVVVIGEADEFPPVGTPPGTVVYQYL